MSFPFFPQHASLIAVVAMAGCFGGELAQAQTVEESVPLAALPALPVDAEPATPARTSAIPEPMSLAVFGTGLLLLLRRRRV